MSGRLCDVEGCDDPRYGRGLCSYHYQRWLRHGDPLLGGLRSPNLSAAEIRRISDLVDAACPRYVEILHPNFSIPADLNPVYLGPEPYDTRGRRRA